MKGFIIVCISLLCLIGCASAQNSVPPSLSEAITKDAPLVVVIGDVTTTPPIGQTPAFRVDAITSPATITPEPTSNSNTSNITVVPLTEAPPPELETTRVAFAPGASAVRLVGEVAANQRVSYALGAMEGQEMQLLLTSSSGGVRLAVQTVTGRTLLPLAQNSAEWRGILPRTDDYIVSAVADDVDSTYEINVTILPLGAVGATETVTVTRLHNRLGNVQFLFEGVPRNQEELNVRGVSATVQGKSVLAANGLDTFSRVNDANVGLRLLDVNFDGYDDVLLQRFMPAGPTIPYIYYLYNPALGQFVRDEAYRHISSPEVDPINRTIISSEQMGAVGSVITTYQVEANKPVAVRVVQELLLVRANRYLYTVEDAAAGDLLLLAAGNRGVGTIPAVCPTPSAQLGVVVNLADGYCFAYPAEFEATHHPDFEAVQVVGPQRGQGSNLRWAILVVRGAVSAEGRPLEQVIEDRVVAMLTEGEETPSLISEEMSVGTAFAVGLAGFPLSDGTEQLVLTLQNDTIYEIVRYAIADPIIEQDTLTLWTTVSDTFEFLPPSE